MFYNSKVTGFLYFNWNAIHSFVWFVLFSLCSASFHFTICFAYENDLEFVVFFLAIALRYFSTLFNWTSIKFLPYALFAFNFYRTLLVCNCWFFISNIFACPTDLFKTEKEKMNRKRNDSMFLSCIIHFFCSMFASLCI